MRILPNAELPHNFSEIIRKFGHIPVWYELLVNLYYNIFCVSERNYCDVFHRVIPNRVLIKRAELFDYINITAFLLDLFLFCTSNSLIISHSLKLAM